MSITEFMRGSRRLRHAWLLLPLLAGPAVTRAEDVTELEPIQVEGEAIAESFPGYSEVDLASVRRQSGATSDTASLLLGIPGVSMNGAGGVSSLPSIHGLADDRLRIKLDGMDLVAACPNHMNPPLSYLDPANVGSLRVYAGISPVSEGGDSIGGTIIAETEDPVFATGEQGQLLSGEVASYYRSNNQAFGVNAGASLASETMSLRYSGAWSQADNYTAGAEFKNYDATGRPGHTLPRDEVGSTAWETENHTLAFAWNNSGGVLELRLGYQDMPQQLYPNQRMDLLDNQQVRVGADWKSVADWGRWEAGAYYETVDHYMDFGPDKRFWYGSLSAPPFAAEVGTPCAPPGFLTCAAGMPMYSEGDTAGADLKTEIDLANEGLLRLGAEYRRYRLDDYWPPSGSGMWPGTFHNINDGRRDRHAAYAEWESVLNPRWLAQLGARYERVISDAGDVAGYATVMPAPGNQIPEALAFNARERRQTDDNLDLTALARYTFSDTAGLEFGVARKVRSPNLYERYTWSTWAMPAAMNNLVGDGNGYVGDIDLRPEVAYTASLTFDRHAADRAWELRVTPYYTRVHDYIDAVALPGWALNQYNVLRYANQAARIFGIDFSAEIQLMENRSGKWKLSSVVAWTDGENRDTGDVLYNIMPLNGRFTLGHKLGGWDSSLEWVVVDAKDELSQVRNEIATSGYGLFNLRMGHEWKRFRVDAGIENMFDRFYTLPSGGAYLGQGTTMMLNAVPWGTGVPGMGRSFYAGFTVKFE